MRRPLIYTAELIRDYDAGSGWRDALDGLAIACAAILGQTNSLASGLSAGPQSPASLAVNINPGSMFQFIQVDPLPAGSLPASNYVALIQGTLDAQLALALSTAGLSAGQSQWSLIEAQVTFVDSIRPGDPDGGVLGFENSGNPLGPPLEGPGGSGETLPTMRQPTVQFQIKTGAAATTGSEVPPSADAGWVGLFLIDLAFGQTTITLGNILVAGPSVGTGVPNNYPVAPFLAGLLNSHHSGATGQAPQIKLASEVQGTLGLGNLPASSSASGVLPVLRSGSGAPTAVGGNVDDLYYDTAGQNLYICTVAGLPGAATWVIVVTVAGATPTGAAGGDLAGSFPNPQVAGIQGKAIAAPSVAKTIPYYTGSVIAWLNGGSGILPGASGAFNLRGQSPGGSQFQVTADFITLRNPSDNTLTLVPTFNSTVDISVTGPAANARDASAAFGSNSFYHLYAIGGGGQTPALIASANAPSTGPTLPASYTSWAYIGAFLIGTAPNVVPCRLRGSRITYDQQQPLAGTFTNTSETVVSVATLVPTIAQRLLLNIFGMAVSAGGAASIVCSIRDTTGVDYYELSWRLQINQQNQASDSIDIPNVGQQFLYQLNTATGNPTMDFWIRGYDVPNGAC